MADENRKVIATNVSEGPKVLNSIPATILQPGQSTDGEVDISTAEFASMEGTGYFTFADPLDHDGDGKKGGSKPRATTKADDA